MLAQDRIIAHTVSPLSVSCRSIFDDMLMRAHNPDFKMFNLPEWTHDLKFKAGTFDKVTARMCFHHIIEHAKGDG